MLITRRSSLPISASTAPSYSTETNASWKATTCAPTTRKEEYIFGGEEKAVSAGAPPEEFYYDQQDIKEHGLGVITAAIFLAGEMAGSGVLALPYAMVGSGWYGLLLIPLFTINACFSGTRLGLCWVILEERYPEFKGIIRDPYPTIGEKAVGRWGRILSLICISVTLYGGGCVFIVLIAQFFQSIFQTWIGIYYNLCLWMFLTSLILAPLTWMGTPKDFWPIAVGALLTTMLACLLIVIQSVLDHYEMKEEPEFPEPHLEGICVAFSSVMFAFAGASTFPTIQADMRQREKFNISATVACVLLFIIYFPMAAGGYFSYGSAVSDNVVLTIKDGVLRLVVEIMILLHLIAAFPIITNPPSQFFEFLLDIPSDFNWKRCVFRTFSVLALLFIAETIPSFGSILGLVGASTVTLLTFVFPPLFYMRLCDQSCLNKEWVDRKLPIWERVYCWVLILIGIAGGLCSTYVAAKSIFNAEKAMALPCYLQDFSNVTEKAAEIGGH